MSGASQQGEPLGFVLGTSFTYDPLRNKFDVTPGTATQIGGYFVGSGLQASVTGVLSVKFGVDPGTSVQGNDSRLAAAATAVQPQQLQLALAQLAADAPAGSSLVLGTEPGTAADGGALEAESVRARTAESQLARQAQATALAASAAAAAAGAAVQPNQLATALAALPSFAPNAAGHLILTLPGGGVIDLGQISASNAGAPSNNVIDPDGTNVIDPDGTNVTAS